jgi:hypothetical protein
VNHPVYNIRVVVYDHRATLLHTYVGMYYIIARSATPRMCILTVVLRAGLLANVHVVVTERSNAITTAIKVVSAVRRNDESEQNHRFMFYRLLSFFPL